MEAITQMENENPEPGTPRTEEQDSNGYGSLFLVAPAVYINITLPLTVIFSLMFFYLNLKMSWKR